MSKTKLDYAVEAIQERPEFITDGDFINLMGALHEQLSIVSCHVPFNKDELIAAQDAVGEFVPVNWS